MGLIPKGFHPIGNLIKDKEKAYRNADKAREMFGIRCIVKPVKRDKEIIGFQCYQRRG